MVQGKAGRPEAALLAGWLEQLLTGKIDRVALAQVKIPKSISSEERKLMEQLRELQGAKPASRGWF